MRNRTRHIDKVFRQCEYSYVHFHGNNFQVLAIIDLTYSPIPEFVSAMKFFVTNITLITFRASFFSLVRFHVSFQVLFVGRCVFTKWAFEISTFYMNTCNMRFQLGLI